MDNLSGDEVTGTKRSDLKHRILPKSSVTSPEPSSSSTRLTITQNENPNLPDWLVKAMKKYNGYDAKLVIKEKELFPTDLDREQARLSFPPKQVVCSDYLTEEEIKTLESNPQDNHRKKGVSVVFLDKNNGKYDLELRKWNNKSLVLTKGWKKVIETNSIKVKDKFPLWCFRSEQEKGKLYFALVPKDEDKTETESSSSMVESIGHAPKDSPAESMGCGSVLPHTMESDDHLIGDLTHLGTLSKDSGCNIDSLPDMDTFDEIDEYDSYFNKPVAVVKDTGNAQKDP